MTHTPIIVIREFRAEAIVFYIPQCTCGWQSEDIYSGGVWSENSAYAEAYSHSASSQVDLRESK